MTIIISINLTTNLSIKDSSSIMDVTSELIMTAKMCQ